MEYILIFLAGLTITLSPCVLPILPMIVSNALQVHVYAPLLLVLGLIASFTLIGVGTIWLGHFWNGEIIRWYAACILMLFGLIMSSRLLQGIWSQHVSRFTSRFNQTM